MVAVPLVGEFIFVGLLWFFLHQAHDQATMEAYSRRVLFKLNKIGNSGAASALALVGYGMSHQPEDLEKYEIALALRRTAVDSLRADLRNPGEVAAYEKWLVMNTELLQLLDKVRKEIDANRFGLPEMFKFRAEAAKLLARGQPQEQYIANQYQVVEDQSTRKQEQSYRFFQLVLVVGIIAHCLLALALSRQYSRSIVRRLDVLMDNTEKIVGEQPLNEIVQGDDEISKLDSSFHKTAESLKIARRRERAVVENAPNIVCSVTADGRFLSVNPASIKLWGYKPEELRGLLCSDLVVDHKGGAFFPPEAFQMESLSFENLVRRSDGELRDMLWITVWSPIENMFFCVVHDITERKEAERFKQRVMNMVSHDLRTPLTAIQGSLALLSSGAIADVPKQVSDLVNVANRNSQRMLKMINDLLDADRAAAGELPLDIRPTKMASIFSQMRESVAHHSVSKKITLAIPDVDCEVAADEDRLVQVVVNLTANAIKFSPENSTITFSVSPTVGSQDTEVSAACEPGKATESGSGQGMVRIAVTDQGRGIPAEAMCKLFQPFRQVLTDDAKGGKGMGLGLSIAKAIVEQHGGAIGVTSKVGEGSTFWFTLPLAAASEVVSIAEPESSAEAVERASGTESAKNVGIVVP